MICTKQHYLRQALYSNAFELWHFWTKTLLMPLFWFPKLKFMSLFIKQHICAGTWNFASFFIFCSWQHLDCNCCTTFCSLRTCCLNCFAWYLVPLIQPQSCKNLGGRLPVVVTSSLIQMLDRRLRLIGSCSCWHIDFAQPSLKFAHVCSSPSKTWFFASAAPLVSVALCFCRYCSLCISAASTLTFIALRGLQNHSFWNLGSRSSAKVSFHTSFRFWKKLMR